MYGYIISVKRKSRDWANEYKVALHNKDLDVVVSFIFHHELVNLYHFIREYSKNPDFEAPLKKIIEGEYQVKKEIDFDSETIWITSKKSDFEVRAEKFIAPLPVKSSLADETITKRLKDFYHNNDNHIQLDIIIHTMMNSFCEYEITGKIEGKIFNLKETSYLTVIRIYEAIEESIKTKKS